MVNYFDTFIFFLFSELVIHSFFLNHNDTVLRCFFFQPVVVSGKPLRVRLRTTAHYAASASEVNNEI